MPRYSQMREGDAQWVCEVAWIQPSSVSFPHQSVPGQFAITRNNATSNRDKYARYGYVGCNRSRLCARRGEIRTRCHVTLNSTLVCQSRGYSGYSATLRIQLKDTWSVKQIYLWDEQIIQTQVKYAIRLRMKMV